MLGCVHDPAGMSKGGAGLPRIPAVEKLLGSNHGRSLLNDYSRPSVVEALRTVLESLRATIRDGGRLRDDALSPASICDGARRGLERAARRRSRPVVNATGVVLHTNLGRALLAPSAAQAAYVAATRPLALEYDVERGRRGDRDDLVEEHLRALTGAEAATVVNNNAAAVLLTLNTLAQGREVVVSRGELIEIGGSFRIPEILAKSGAILREVGTTNRTHLADYDEAIGPRTALLLKVHTSNYRIVGFTASVDVDELSALASRHGGLPVVEDLGAGALMDLTTYGLQPEPVVADRLRSGADVVTLSGDKLLGGPQCGVVVGKRALVESIRRNPLKRALRCDKSTLAALEETLRIYRFDPAPERSLPVLAQLVRPVEALEALGTEALTLLAAALGEAVRITLEKTEARVGSGSQPEVAIESRAVALRSTVESADELAARFRGADPPIIGRIEREVFYLDLRAVERASDLLPSGLRPAAARTRA
jgi:L-seryl-tRNA(Ser) seleniumtransferase